MWSDVIHLKGIAERGITNGAEAILQNPSQVALSLTGEPHGGISVHPSSYGSTFVNFI
jgi:hypothetical protein